MKENQEYTNGDYSEGAVGGKIWDRIIAGISRLCGFFHGYRDVRQPGSKNERGTRQPRSKNYCFWIPAVLYPGHTPLFSAGIH